MTTERDDRMASDVDTDGSVEGSSVTESTEHGQVRRRLIKAGLAAVPVIVTLKALPVRADAGGMGSLGEYGYSNPGPGRGREPIDVGKPPKDLIDPMDPPRHYDRNRRDSSGQGGRNRPNTPNQN